MVIYSVLGFIAASLSPLAMAFGFIIWGKSWQGSAYALNVFKCSLAGFIFMIVAFSFPSGGTPGIYSQSMVVLSSIIGIIIGDNTWLMALQIIGAKRVIVIDALKPFCAAFAAYFILDEPLTLKICIGVLVSSLGVVMVSIETPEITPTKEDLTTENSEYSDSTNSTSLNIDKANSEPASISTSSMLWGYILAAINVILDAFGSVLTKQFGTEMNTWEINFLRFGFAAIIMGCISAVMFSYEYIIISKLKKFQELSESMHALNIIATSPIENIKQSANTNSITMLDETIEVQSVLHHQQNRCSYSNITNNMENGKFSRLEMHDEQCEYDSERIDKSSLSSTNNTTNSSSCNDHSRWYSFPTRKEMSRIQWIHVALGVMFVTFLCPAMSNYALFKLPLSLCLTLNSLGPVYSIPLVYMMLKEHSGWQSILGSVLAVGGIAIMCF